MFPKNFYMSRITPVIGLLLIAGCTVLPTGPSVMVLPGTGQTLERFREDDGFCRQYALAQIGGKTADQASKESAVTTAAVGTAVGTVAGAAIGGNARGAGVGAGVGLLFGGAMGSESSRASGSGTQRAYDVAFIQCMYSKGHRVPVPGNVSYSKPPVQAADIGIPPPPKGLPPPPPPSEK